MIYPCVLKLTRQNAYRYTKIKLKLRYPAHFLCLNHYDWYFSNIDFNVNGRMRWSGVKEKSLYYFADSPMKNLATITMPKNSVITLALPL